MTTTGIDTDILIVGAGPVGLFLANECARRGMRWRIVEERATQSEHSKALAIFPRTMEIFDMAGIVAPFLEAANRVTTVAVMAHDSALARMEFRPEDSPYAFVAMVPQNITERILADELQRKGGQIEYETKFISAEQKGDYVQATLERKGEIINVTAAFVIGCDGAHSAIRHLLQIPFAGAEYKDSFVLADVDTNSAVPASELLLCPSEDGPVAIFPISNTRRRIVASIEQQEGDVPSLDLIQRILAQRAPSTVQATAIHWSSYFRIHHRHVARMRVERFFIAGDAAHIHSPFGGQGMNTGLHDVWNLVWKLDLFLRGHGNEQLLESYSEERLPVIRAVINLTHLLTRVLGTPNKFAQVLRDTIIPMVSRLAPFQHAFVQRLSELGIEYSDSPIIEDAGQRYFNESMRNGGIKGRFLLMNNADAGSSTASVLQEFAKSLDTVLELRSSHQPGLTLVRPDGYEAFRASTVDESTMKSLRSLIERQTRRG